MLPTRQALWAGSAFPSSYETDWFGQVNNTLTSGTAGAGKVWPLTQVMYMYSYKSLVGFGSKGPLTAALFQ